MYVIVKQSESLMYAIVEWSREMLLEAWMSDPLQCCDKSGVHPPSSVFCDKPVVQQSLHTDQHRPETQKSTGVVSQLSCVHIFSICFDVICYDTP